MSAFWIAIIAIQYLIKCRCVALLLIMKQCHHNCSYRHFIAFLSQEHILVLSPDVQNVHALKPRSFEYFKCKSYLLLQENVLHLGRLEVFITVNDKRSRILDPIAFHLTLTVSIVETKRRIGIMDTSRGLHITNTLHEP